jgi:hypothetical protein
VIQARFDAHGKLNFWFICATPALRDLVERRMLVLFPTLNYGVGWRDVKGFGLQMAECEWKPKLARHYYRQ